MSEKDADSNAGDIEMDGTMENTLENTLFLFPLASERKVTKRSRIQVEDEKTQDVPFETVLFPSEEEVLEQSFDRFEVVSTDSSLKRRKQPSGSLTILNRRISAVLEKASIVDKFYHPKPPKLRKPRKPPVFVEPKKTYVYMEPNEFNVRMVLPYKLFDYQIDAIRWMIEREDGSVRHPLYRPDWNGCMLAMVMGLGKTPTAATLIMKTLHQQRMAKSCSIYVCPKNLLGQVRFELEKFFGDQLRIMVYHQNFLRSTYNHFGTEEIRKYDVIITNYSTITSRLGKDREQQKNQKVKEFADFEWYRIILDESHEIRERTTIKFKSVMSMKSPRRICLTGTPIHNKITDLYNQLQFTGLDLPYGTKPTKENLTLLKISNMIRFVEYKDAQSVTLPPKHIHKVYFDLSDEERKLHRFYSDTARSMVANAKSKNNIQALAGMVRVLQVCSAPYLVTNASKGDDNMCEIEATIVFPMDEKLNRWINDRDGTAGLQSSKMRKFVETVDALKQGNPEIKIVVFANMTSTLRLAYSKLVSLYDQKDQEIAVLVTGDMPIMKREEAFTKFRANRVNVLLMTLKLGSIGLNLTEADTVIFLEPWYSYASLSQGESRVHRIGQKNEVNVYYLLGRDSAEERVFRVAQNKKTMAEDVKLGTVESTTNKLDSNEMKFILMED